MLYLETTTGGGAPADLAVVARGGSFGSGGRREPPRHLDAHLGPHLGHDRHHDRHHGRHDAAFGGDDLPRPRTCAQRAVEVLTT